MGMGFRFAAVIGATALIAAAIGCGPVEPSDELVELEQYLQDEKSQQLRDLPNAERYFDEARQYRRVAEEAREERRGERSREYAMLGLLRYETALAVHEKFQTVEKLDDVNQRIEEVNPELREVTQARNELAEQLRDLDGQIREAVQERERQRLAAQREADFDPADDGSDTQQAADLEEANELISRAEQLQQEALEYNADEFSETRGMYGRAERQFENARDMVREHPRAASTAKRQLGFAVQLFEEIVEQAEPLYEDWTVKMQPANRIEAIRDEAAANFGAQFAEDSSGGVRVIMARLFAEGEESFARETGPMLNALASIASEYEEFRIRIVGYTRRAGAETENLALSQARAQRVSDHLIDAGIDTGRISHEGEGQSNIRFSDSPANNDRVEVVLRHQDR